MPGLSERSYSNRASYCVPRNGNGNAKFSRRSWSNSNADKEDRRPRFAFFGPDWMLPKKMREMLATATVTIWGYAGRMADIVEVP